MMKNFMPSMPLILAYLIVTIMSSLILLDFSSVYSFSIYIVKVSMFFVACYCLGLGLGYGTTKIRDKVTQRHSKRFNWYLKMGFYESGYLVEPRLARNLSKYYWKMFF